MFAASLSFESFFFPLYILSLLRSLLTLVLSLLGDRGQVNGRVTGPVNRRHGWLPVPRAIPVKMLKSYAQGFLS